MSEKDLVTRKVYKIDVGNLPPDEVLAFIEKVKEQMKRGRIEDATHADGDEAGRRGLDRDPDLE